MSQSLAPQDSSGLQQPRQMLELTSEDCLWRASQPGMGANASWRTIEKPQLLYLWRASFPSVVFGLKTDSYDRTHMLNLCDVTYFEFHNRFVFLGRSVPDKDGDEFTAFKFSPSSKGQKLDLGLLG